MQEKLQLYKPDKESKYRIVADNKNKNYVICRQDYNGINVMDPNGEIIFVINELNSTITSFKQRGQNWYQYQTITTLPPGFERENAITRRRLMRG